jgi:hypothetical protein
MASSIFEQSPRRSIVAGALIAFSTAALAAARPAQADAPPSKEAIRAAARAKLVEGVDALRRGEHRVALERFEEAYVLVPSPKIHYDFALAYLGLGRRAEALSAFERFLAEAQDAPRDKREKATGQAAVLRPQVGAIAVAVEGAPSGAAIAVDGLEVGRVPLARSVYVDPGRHEIAVRLSRGGAGPVQRIEIQAGGRMDVVLRVDGATSGGGVALAPTTAVPLPSSTGPPPASDGQAPTAPAAVGAALESTAPSAPPRGMHRVAAVSLSAAGVVLIAAGVTFGVLAKRESDSLSADSVMGAATRMPTPFDPEKESHGTTYEALQVIGVAAGAVGLAAGIVLYATTRGRVTVEPLTTRSRAGANLQVAF